MNRSLQRGFTLNELIHAIAFLAFWGLVIAVVVHFVLKFW
jgi:type II secretory pathway component PulJ